MHPDIADGRAKIEVGDSVENLRVFILQALGEGESSPFSDATLLYFLGSLRDKIR